MTSIIFPLILSRLGPSWGRLKPSWAVKRARAALTRLHVCAEQDVLTGNYGFNARAKRARAALTCSHVCIEQEVFTGTDGFNARAKWLA